MKQYDRICTNRFKALFRFRVLSMTIFKNKLTYKIFFSFILVFLVTKGGVSEPQPWQLGFSEPVTNVASELQWFHDDILMPVITAITIFVLLLLAFVCIRFSEKNNPKPSKTTHHALLEVVWTVVPVIILALIFIPSMRLLYMSDDSSNADMVIKAIGNQWYWSYEYPDHDNLLFDSYMLAEEDLDADRKHLYKMAVDYPMVVPVNTKIKLLITSKDVLHNWAVSPFGVRMDAVPGRLNESWFEASKTGVYYGFCSELCGQGHAYMPIEVHVVEQQEFEQWLLKAKEEFASHDEKSILPAKHVASK